MTLDEARVVCLYKLGAARFHYENIESAYHAVKPAMFEWTKNFPSTTPQEVMPIFYHLDSFLYQLVSCFDMLLQVVNIRSGVGLPVEQVMWKAGVNSGTTTRFMKLLKVNDPTAFDKIDDYYRNDLFVSLKKLRDHVAHRGAQGLSISISEECGTTAVSIAGQPYEIVERCEVWGKFVGDIILDVDPDLRKKI